MTEQIWGPRIIKSTKLIVYEQVGMRWDGNFYATWNDRQNIGRVNYLLLHVAFLIRINFF